MITADDLHGAIATGCILHIELDRLIDKLEQAAAALSAAEGRATVAEGKLSRLRAKQRQPPIDTQLVKAARALLSRLDTITTEDFARGGEAAEREALRAVLVALDDEAAQTTESERP